MVDSDSRAIGFSLRTSYFLAHCSFAAYEASGEWPNKLGLGDTVRFFEREGFHGFVAAQPNMAIIAFRGTNSLGNALTDAQTMLVRHNIFPGRVHQGFSYAADVVFSQVRRLLVALGGQRPIWITGHSLGGAMATLAAYRLVAEDFPVRAVYTYGSPRPGDGKFRDAYPLPNFRFVNDNDLVPHLPMQLCYHHVGDLKLLTNDGQLQEEERDWKHKKRQLVKHAKIVQRAQRKQDNPPLKIGEFDWLSDHSLEGYLKGIAGLLPRVPRRRHPDYAGLELDSLPLQYLDEPVEPVQQQPNVIRVPYQPASPITQADLAMAFSRQPHQRKAG